MNLGTRFSPSQAGSSEFQDHPVQELMTNTPALRGAGVPEAHLLSPESVHSCFQFHGPHVGSQPPCDFSGKDCLRGLPATCCHEAPRVSGDGSSPRGPCLWDLCTSVPSVPSDPHDVPAREALLSLLHS